MHARRGSSVRIVVPSGDDDDASDGAGADARPGLVSARTSMENISTSGTFTVDEFRLNALGLEVETSASGRSREEREGESGRSSASANDGGEEQDAFILGAADLDVVGVIGTGSGGVVRLARNKRTGEALAVKNIEISLARDDDGRRRIITELRTLHKSECDYIVRSVGAYFNRGSVSLVMEFMDGGTMSDATQHLGRWDEEDLAAATSMLADGLHYLHTRLNVVHRDIKPCNVLLNLRGEAKLSDFGVSGHLVDASKCHSWVGTVTYMSPERIQGEPYEYTADVWSFALTVVECALGRFPYNPPDESRRLVFWDLLDIVVKDPVPCLRPELAVSDEFDNFVALGLNKDPSGRMLTKNMIAHPWIFGRDRREDKRRIAALSARHIEVKSRGNSVDFRRE